MRIGVRGSGNVARSLGRALLEDERLAVPGQKAPSNSTICTGARRRITVDVSRFQGDGTLTASTR